MTGDYGSNFFNSLEEYRRKQALLSVPLKIIRANIIRFEVDYLSRELFFKPYPVDLVKITDPGKGRDY